MSIWIYQRHQKKKKNKNMQIHEILPFFCTSKENKKKKIRLIKDKMQIKNANMR